MTMKQVKCADCAIEYSANETFNVSGKVVCRACAEKILADKDLKTKPVVERQTDPTICVKCGKDNGRIDFHAVAGLPACPQCESLIRNRPFPQWIKVAMVAVVGLVIFSFAWNMRFIRAYIDIRMATKHASTGAIEKAAEYMNKASAYVPEDKNLHVLSNFYAGISLLQREKWNQAIEKFSCCSNTADPGLQTGISDGITRSKIGLAFENKDYDGFLRLAMQMNNAHPNDQTYIGQVASAYACKYAQSGEQSFKITALEWLEKAKKLTTTENEVYAFDEYDQRIQHRLYTREIIDRKEFSRRFPNGWQQPKE
jgi:DNA-directed RNA polymerase subunit RPC12/RpoP